jgi:hypothetical protein
MIRAAILAVLLNAPAWGIGVSQPNQLGQVIEIEDIRPLDNLWTGENFYREGIFLLDNLATPTTWVFRLEDGNTAVLTKLDGSGTFYFTISSPEQFGVGVEPDGSASIYGETIKAVAALIAGTTVYAGTSEIAGTAISSQIKVGTNTPTAAVLQAGTENSFSALGATGTLAVGSGYLEGNSVAQVWRAPGGEELVVGFQSTTGEPNGFTAVQDNKAMAYALVDTSGVPQSAVILSSGGHTTIGAPSDTGHDAALNIEKAVATNYHLYTSGAPALIWGGAYTFDIVLGCQKTNPLTGACSCGTGFSSELQFSGVNLGACTGSECEYFVCWRR